MKSSITETKFLLYTVSAIFLLMMVRVFLSQINNIYNPINYVGIHSFLEIICIAISITIFLYGIKKFSTIKSLRLLLLAFTFFTVGMIDIFHTLSYKGMPFFITPSSVQKATWFWVIARIIQSILMLALVLLPDRKVRRDYRFLSVALGLLLTGTIGFIIISFEKSLPLLVVEGKGTTLLKNSIEYGVSFILFISLMVSLYQYYMDKREDKLLFALAFVFLLLTELIFTIYQSVFDLDNFLGHVYKVFGFYFILKGFYFTEFLDESSQLNKGKSMLDHPGLFFGLKRQGNHFICTNIEGELLKDIHYGQKEIVGRPISEILHIHHASMNDYCYLTNNLQECVTFEMEFLDKFLLISIKPSVDEYGGDVILGTAMDMTGMFPGRFNPKSFRNEENKNAKVVSHC
ncbi:preprotein translocase subunit Sss1 [Neobacillus niacini]|uniref:MASE3 domain-containing protein n=1 Tax=Neobacillus niacini TaxID=86668 RepID=UPI0028567D8E|nr:MASE3 domain-containing protein [Neobacillus niacini]MDR7079943.1 preprotein translocase subunit Sss1 [Neobacillus niacini]